MFYLFNIAIILINKNIFNKTNSRSQKEKKKNNNEILFSIGLGKIFCFHAMVFLD